MHLLRRFLHWLRPMLPYVNIGLVLAAYVANKFLTQVFCQPVRWAAIVLVVCTGAFLAWPFIHRLPSWWRYAALFLQGSMLLICVYCIWFFGLGTYVGSVFWAVILFWMLLLPLLVWVPMLFSVQLLRRAWTSQLPGALIIFGLGAMAPMLAQVWADYQFRNVQAVVNQLPASQRQNTNLLAVVVPRTYMAERLAGTQFKYHNYFCAYDGIRPALHDPLVNVSLWLRGGADIMGGNQDSIFKTNPLYLSPANLNRQATLYHRLFPNQPLNADCNCTNGEGRIIVTAQ